MASDLVKLCFSTSDCEKMLTGGVHLGSNTSDPKMRQYIFKRKPDGAHILNIQKTQEKITLAARMICAIENPADVMVMSARPYGTRAVLKFGMYTGATPIAGRLTPGTFTNQCQNKFSEPRLLVITDPRTDHQALVEAAYVNIPTIALCNADSPLKYVDLAIPCNNRSQNSIGLVWWLLCREVLRMRGTEARGTEWSVLPDLFIYRDPTENEEEKEAARTDAVQPAKEGFQPDWAAEASVAVSDTQKQWATESVPAVAPPATEDWSTDTGSWAPPGVPAAAAAAPMAAAAAPAPAAAPVAEWGGTTENWG